MALSRPWLPQLAPVHMRGRGPDVLIDRLLGPLAVMVWGQPEPGSLGEVQPHPGALRSPAALAGVGYQGLVLSWRAYPGTEGQALGQLAQHHFKDCVCVSKQSEGGHSILRSLLEVHNDGAQAPALQGSLGWGQGRLVCSQAREGGTQDQDQVTGIDCFLHPGEDG